MITHHDRVGFVRPDIAIRSMQLLSARRSHVTGKVAEPPNQVTPNANSRMLLAQKSSFTHDRRSIVALQKEHLYDRTQAKGNGQSHLPGVPYRALRG